MLDFLLDLFAVFNEDFAFFFLSFDGKMTSDFFLVMYILYHDKV